MTTQTRPTGRIAGRAAFADLKECKCWAQAELLLRDGEKTPSVARFIHEQGEMTHLKHSALMRKLRRYRADVIVPLETSSLIDTLTKNRSLKMNNLDELTKIILVQKDRVEKDLALEKNMPKTMSSLTKEISILFDLIERREKIMQDSGEAPRAPTKHMVGVGVISGGSWEKMLGALPDDQRVEIRRAIQEKYAEEHREALDVPYRSVDDKDEKDGTN